MLTLLMRNITCIISIRIFMLEIIIILLWEEILTCDCTPVPEISHQELLTSDFQTGLPIVTLTNEPSSAIQCIRYHEYAVFVRHDGMRNMKPSNRPSQIPLLRTFVNQNGNVKRYFCQSCSQCGKGVRILAHCQLHQDTVCSKSCIYPEWVYDYEERRCYPTTYSYTTASRPAFTIHDFNVLYEENPLEINEKTWDKKLIVLWAVFVGVLTLNIMLGILLVWKRREWKWKKTAENRMKYESEGRVQNNSSLEAETNEQSRSDLQHTHVDVDLPSPTVAPSHNHIGDNVVNPNSRSTNRIKESNLNQYAVNYQPDIESHTDISAAINIMQPQTIPLPNIKVKPGTNPYWIEMSGYFGTQGGELSCDQSDVVIEIPPGAIPASHPRQLIVARVSRTPGILPVSLANGALFLSPLVDCESPGLNRFEKDVLIKLPHRAHLGPTWQFTVHYTKGSSAAQLDWRKVRLSCQEARRDLRNAADNIRQISNDHSSDVQFTIDDKYVHITTPHFSKYTCSGCGKERELSFEAVVYVNDIQLDADRRVDLHCYLLDSIKDFQSKVNYNEPYRPHSEHKPLIINAKQGKELEVSLVDMGDNWPWKADERIHKTTQIVHLDDIVRCHSDVVPDFVTFTLRPRYQDRQTNSPDGSSILEAAVSIKQKSRMKRITVDVALNLEEHSSNGQSRMQDADKKIKSNLEEVFLMLSKKITARQWRPLFRHLMMTTSGSQINVEADISFIENNDPQDVQEQIYKGFVRWRLVSGKDATLQRLCENLRKVGLVALAEEVEDSTYPSDVKTNTQITDAENIEDINQLNVFNVLETDV